VQYWANLQSVHGFRCYDNIEECKLTALYTANYYAYSAERVMSARTCLYVLALCLVYFKFLEIVARRYLSANLVDRRQKPLQVDWQTCAQTSRTCSSNHCPQYTAQTASTTGVGRSTETRNQLGRRRTDSSERCRCCAKARAIQNNLSRTLQISLPIIDAGWLVLLFVLQATIALRAIVA